MKIGDLEKYIYDKIVIYRKVKKSNIETDFEDIYKGFLHSAPNDILKLEIKTIGAKKAGVVDIRVE